MTEAEIEKLKFKLIDLYDGEEKEREEAHWARETRHMNDSMSRDWFAEHFPEHKTGWCISGDYYYFAACYIFDSRPELGRELCEMSLPALRQTLNKDYDFFHLSEVGPDEFNACFLRGLDPDLPGLSM